jgi:hypothetical protein
VKGRDEMGEPGVDWRIILRWILKKYRMMLWAGFVWLRIGTDGGFL